MCIFPGCQVSWPTPHGMVPRWTASSSGIRMPCIHVHAYSFICMHISTRMSSHKGRGGGMTMRGPFRGGSFGYLHGPPHNPQRGGGGITRWTTTITQDIYT